MSRVSYQLADEPTAVPPAFVPLGATSITTRNRDATTSLDVDVSKRQARWLKKAGSGGEVDAAQILRALIDLGMELELDWPRLTSGSDLRAAVRAAVLIRRSS